MKSRSKLRTYDLAGLALAGFYALSNVVAIGPATWPHHDGNLLVFFFTIGFAGACALLILYYAVIKSLRYSLNGRCILASFVLLLGAEAFTFWVLARASMDV